MDDICLREPSARLRFQVSEMSDGERLDVFLSGQVEDASRSFLQRVIRSGGASINGEVCTRPSQSVHRGDEVEIVLPPPPTTSLEPQNIPLDIVYEDSELVVVNKPSGMVVHPAPGHYSGTLVHALLYHCKDFCMTGSDPLRPGIVHRLDRDTSGLLVIAKTPQAFSCLAEQARNHQFEREYWALVKGEFKEDRGRIEAAVGRSISDPKRITVTSFYGRDAVTHFQVLERFGMASLLSVRLETGRTHQIRVHLRFAGHPVLGDPIYGVTDFSSWRIPEQVRFALQNLKGQALHARKLGFVHPVSGEKMFFTAEPPKDFQGALEALRLLHVCN